MDNCPWAPTDNCPCMGIHKIVHACISPCTLIQVVVLTELDTWSIGVLMPMQVSTFPMKISLNYFTFLQACEHIEELKGGTEYGGVLVDVQNYSGLKLADPTMYLYSGLGWRSTPFGTNEGPVDYHT